MLMFFNIMQEVEGLQGVVSLVDRLQVILDLEEEEELELVSGVILACSQVECLQQVGRDLSCYFLTRYPFSLSVHFRCWFIYEST